MLKKPGFSLSLAIVIPDTLWKKTPYKKDYPLQFTIELLGTTENFDFDVLLV